MCGGCGVAGPDHDRHELIRPPLSSRHRHRHPEQDERRSSRIGAPGVSLVVCSPAGVRRAPQALVGSIPPRCHPLMLWPAASEGASPREGDGRGLQVDAGHGDHWRTPRAGGGPSGVQEDGLPATPDDLDRHGGWCRPRSDGISRHPAGVADFSRHLAQVISH